MKFLTLGEKIPKKDIQVLTSSAIVYDYMKDTGDLDREAVFVVHVDSRLRILKRELVSLGTLGGSLVNPREVFRQAIVNNSAGIIMVHNHPSGDPTPSKQDIEVTGKMKAAGELLGIDFLDHIIVTNTGRYTSLADNKVL